MGQMNAITGFITQLLTQHVGQFASLGQGMFLSLSTIMIVWFGLKAALSAGERGAGFQFSNFAGLVLMIAFGYAMIEYYDTPIPGIGRGRVRQWTGSLCGGRSSYLKGESHVAVFDWRPFETEGELD